MEGIKFDLNGLPFEMKTLQDLVNRSEESYKNFPSVQFFEGKELKTRSYQMLAEDTRRLSNAIAQLPGENGNIALVGQNSYRWIVTFLAICCAGRTAVLVDANASARDLRRFLLNGELSCVVCDASCREKVSSVCKEFTQAIPIYSIELLDGMIGGISVVDQMGKLFITQVYPQTIAAIVFTSGSSGDSKGVMLSHKNLVSDIKACQLLTQVGRYASIFTILPPQHAFQLTAGILTALYVGARIGIGRGTKYVRQDFLLYKPTFIVVVPAIVKSLYRQTKRSVERSNRTKQISRSVKVSEFLLHMGIDLRRILFKEVRAAYGGELCSIICGGAHLENSVVEGMNAIGLRVLTGYGITECSPVVSCNMPERNKVGSVGVGTVFGEVKEYEGELLVRGDIVANGYYGMPEQTAEAFVDGWFHTGDLGYVDRDGFVYVLGRKKNIIVLSNGENISPEELEELLVSIPGVDEAVIHVSYSGDLDYLSAVIYPNMEYSRNCGDKEYERQIREEICKLNQTLSSFKQIKSVEISKEPPKRTASGKLQRLQDEQNSALMNT